MRLAKVKRLESHAQASAAAAAAAVDVGQNIGLCWTQHDQRVEASRLRSGEYIAADVRVVGSVPGSIELRVRERVTTDSGDLGLVYDDASGAQVGRVTRIDGGLLGLEFIVGYAVPDAPEAPEAEPMARSGGGA